MINRNNYESFFLDYLENRLEENVLDEFLEFLKQNPDLRTELNQFESVQLPLEEVAFWGKSHLYKSIEEDRISCERKLIAFMEGDLERKEQESFKYHIAGHPELQEKYNLLSKSRLIADTGIKYPDKQKLYKNHRTFKLTNWIAGAAAVLLIFVGVHSLFQTSDQAILPAPNKETLVIAAPQKIENIAKTSKAAVAEKHSTPAKVKLEIIRQIKPDPDSINNAIILSSLSVKRDSIAPEKLKPVETLLETAATGNNLAVFCPVNSEKLDDRKSIAAVEKYLASCVKKAGDESILSVNRIIRTGLNVATELSGNRIGYQVKDGKISSIEFESEIMAFTIPLQKN
jgi:hypothetical protein